MFYRLIGEQIKEALRYFPVVMLTGARQVGKSTLAMQLIKNYITMDDVSVYSSVKEDALLFISSLNPPITIDEVQKSPEILLAIKQPVDKNRVNGHYLLTGSANIIAFKTIADTLAGRIAIFELMPLSMKEINSKTDSVLDILFNGSFLNYNYKSLPDSQIINTVLKGGYPEIQKIDSEYGRYLWFSSYISTYIERDIRIIGDLRHLDKFIKLYNILASRSANIIVKSELSKTVGIDVKTISNYLKLLELVYQIYILRPYQSNIGKRFVKSEKFFFTDTGVLSYLLNIKDEKTFLKSEYKGHIFETFVFAELLKSIKYGKEHTNIFYYCTKDKREIDFVVERNNSVIAIEVKFAKTVTKSDFKHIVNAFDNINNLEYGFVFYIGDKVIPFGKNMYAIPVSILW